MRRSLSCLPWFVILVQAVSDGSTHPLWTKKDCIFGQFGGTGGKHSITWAVT